MRSSRALSELVCLRPALNAGLTMGLRTRRSPDCKMRTPLTSVAGLAEVTEVVVVLLTHCFKADDA